jgi:hypothetical protein
VRRIVIPTHCTPQICATLVWATLERAPLAFLADDDGHPRRFAGAASIKRLPFRACGNRVILNAGARDVLLPNKRRAVVAADHEVHWGVVCTVIGLATRGIMMIESCKVMAPTENQIPVAWNG